MSLVNMVEDVYLYVYPSQHGELIAQLAEVCASESPADAWSAKLRRDDPRLQKCLALVKAAGLSPWKQQWRARRSDEFLMEISWQYTKHDLDAAELLDLGAKFFVDCWEYEADQVCGLWRNQHLKRNDGVGCAVSQPGIMFVPDRVKLILQEAELNGLLLNPTVQFNKAGRRWHEDELIATSQMWWELCSTVRMPSMSPSLRLWDYRTGKPYDDATSESCGIDAEMDGYCRAPRLRYRRVDLEGLPAFDIAKTYERFGIGPPHLRGDRNRSTIVSQRFRQVCLKHKIRADFVPVEFE